MKKEIVEKLLKAGHITFDEALELMDISQTKITVETINIPAPVLQPCIPVYPSTFPVYPQWWQSPITCDTFTGKEVDTSNWKYIN